MLNNVTKPFFIMTLMVIFLSACTTAPVTYKPPVESRDAPSRQQTPEASQTRSESAQPATPQALPAPSPGSTSTDLPATQPAAIPSNPAVLALLSDAEKYQQQGDMAAAQSRIQRAQRIAPRDPKVYYQLAQTHYELEDYRLAEQVALKGVSYAQGNNTELKRFWLLLADIRNKTGDSAGAKTAREQAARY